MSGFVCGQISQATPCFQHPPAPEGTVGRKNNVSERQAMFPGLTGDGGSILSGLIQRVRAGTLSPASLC